MTPRPSRYGKKIPRTDKTYTQCINQWAREIKDGIRPPPTGAEIVSWMSQECTDHRMALEIDKVANDLVARLREIGMVADVVMKDSTRDEESKENLI